MAISAWSAVLAQCDPAAIMRGWPDIVLVSTMVNCLEGFEESQSDAIVSAGGVLSEKNRWRLDANDNRSMNSCIVAPSSVRVERTDAVVPSRRMTCSDSWFSADSGGW